jgi:hypothetical protein
MKNLTMNLIATAALMVASTVASAQTMTATIPFTFQAGRAVMAPGTYQLSNRAGERWFQLKNVDSNKAIYLAPLGTQDPPREWQSAAASPSTSFIGFACGDDQCVLKSTWIAQTDSAHEFATPKVQEGKLAGLTMIRIVASSAK